MKWKRFSHCTRKEKKIPRFLEITKVRIKFINVARKQEINAKNYALTQKNKINLKTKIVYLFFFFFKYFNFMQMTRAHNRKWTQWLKRFFRFQTEKKKKNKKFCAAAVIDRLKHNTANVRVIIIALNVVLWYWY